MNTRKLDILRRRELKTEKILERDALIVASEEREKRKEAAREIAMKEAENPENLENPPVNPENPEDPEDPLNNFDEEGFLANFDMNDPPIEIPEEIFMDIDDDFYIEQVEVVKPSD